MIIFISIALIIIGLILRFFPPKYNNPLAYRSPITLSKKEAWELGQVTFGKCILILGIILFLLITTLEFFEVIFFKILFFNTSAIIVFVIFGILISALCTEIYIREKMSK